MDGEAVNSLFLSNSHCSSFGGDICANVLLSQNASILLTREVKIYLKVNEILLIAQYVLTNKARFPKMIFWINESLENATAS